MTYTPPPKLGVNPKHWRRERNRVMRATSDLPELWREYQQVIGAWQSRRKVKFVQLATLDRAAIINHLSLLT